MSEDPRTPSIPEPEGDSSTPREENNQPAKPTQPAPSGAEVEPRRRGTGTLIHRFTGSLRKVTSFLSTGELHSEPEETEPQAPAETPQEPQIPQENVSREESPAQPGYMFTGELRADLSLDMEAPQPEEPAVPTTPAAVDWAAELRKEHEQTPPDAGQPPEQPGTGQPLADLEGIDIPLDRMPRMTGQLRSAFTGFLRGPDEELEITDDMLTGRIGGLETHLPAPEQADHLPSLIDDLEDLRGEISIDETAFAAPAAEPQEEDLPEDRLGMFLAEPPVAPVVPSKPIEPSVADLDAVAEDMWKEPPVYSLTDAQPVISVEDIWGTGGEKTEEPPVDEAEPETAEGETPPEVPSPIRTAQLGERKPEEAELPVASPVPAQPGVPDWMESIQAQLLARAAELEEPEESATLEPPVLEPPVLEPPTLEVEEESFPAPAQEVTSKPTDEDISSLRETLTSEDARKRRGSGLFGRITGSLRRKTGSLGDKEKKVSTDPLRSKPSLPPEKLPGDEDAFFSGRLGLGEAPSSSAQPPDLQSTFADIYETPSEAAEPEEQEPSVVEEEAFSFPGDQPAVPETSEPTGWMTELRQETTAESDIFPSTASTTSLPEPAPKPRGVTGQLRAFITNMLRSPEERRRRTAGLDISDDVVTGRLERTMVTGKLKPERPSAAETDYLETPQEPANLPPGTPAFDAEMGKTSSLSETHQRGVTGQLRSFITSILRMPEEREKDTGILELPEIPQPPPKSVTGRLGSNVTAEPAPSETMDIWGAPAETSQPEPFDRAQIVDDLVDFTPAEPTYPVSTPSADLEEGAPPVDRFSMFFGDQATVDADETLEEEEETGEGVVQWGSRQGTVIPGDLPDIFIREEDIAQNGEQEDAAQQVEEEEEAEYPQTGSLFGEASDDDLIASYLGGMNLPGVGEEETLEAPLSSADLTAYNLRSVALEGYQDIYEPKVHPDEEAPAVEIGEDGEAVEFQPEPEAEELQRAEKEKFQLKAWLGVRRNFRMILLAEVVLILLAALVMSPVFLAAIRGTPQPAGPFLVAKPLPPDVPYPTQVIFPGGWDFTLQKSTFIEGKWQPKTAEWLEGTEVRRVLALPWNPQTEAVVQTFKPGDTVGLALNNQDRLNYKITSIERVPVSDTTIYTDNKPSLVIILYEENAEERWVVTCRP